VELERRFRAGEETLRDLIEASLQGTLIVTKEHEPILASVHTLRMIKFPVPGADGEVSDLGAIAAEVTERKHAEARNTIGLCQDGSKRAR